ncbi:hypothetical protein [Halopseudomonas salegens]|uniref:Uncharacterized protein n=1 Tax=Halopseudomonas salegens TaxID=1434072 RepID=A0A1H2HD30_9GAMM|nr:hypothetical protein [Halopseudomonas salegens]SDU29745.1 hypothetical protein SAMN05216210_2952 [Halopseudomonas salegens]
MEVNHPTCYHIAFHFCVSYIPGATIPATRLSKILESIFYGRPLSSVALNYLQQKHLTELYKLATGEMSYESYIAALDPILVAHEQAAKTEHLVQQAECLEQERRRHVEAQRMREARKTDHISRAATQRAQYNQERGSAVAARLSAESMWETQSKQNRELAEAAYSTRMSEPDCKIPTAREIAQHFRVSWPEALTSPLSNILNALYQGRPLSVAYLNYLKLKFQPIYQLAIGQATYESYISDFDATEAAHKTAELARLEQADAHRLRRKQAEAARIAQENDPAYIAQKKHEEKCGRYGIASSNQLPEQLIPILDKLDNGTALSVDEYLWLTSSGKRYFTVQVQRGYHRCQAELCVNDFNRTQYPWHAINGSGHYRKCDMPDEALQLLDRTDMSLLTSHKLKSAFFTTRGGVMRDLCRFKQAVELGMRAYELTPKDFRPCTLLGAVHMELGNYRLGHDWYTKAIMLGADERSVDSELKRIYAQTDKATRKRMKASLLAEDSMRFSWVDDKTGRKD